MNIARFMLLAAVAFLAGCARVATTTTLHADGSFSRKTVYAVSKLSGGLPAQSSGPSKDKPEDFFKIPAGATKSEDKGNLLVTATREVSSGSAPIQDLSLIGDKGKVTSTSTVTVEKLPDGTLRYTEFLHGAAPTSKTQQMAVPDLRARIKKALPEEFQKTELIDGLTHEIMMNLGHALLGPPEPNLFNVMLSPEAAARRINAIAFSANVKSFKGAMPSISDDQAVTMARSLANIINQDAIGGADAVGEAPKENSDPNALTPLFFSVSFPGKIVETNGIVDPVTGEVYWSLLPPALEFGDVKLTVVVRP